jgi:hypothetical protein
MGSSRLSVRRQTQSADLLRFQMAAYGARVSLSFETPEKQLQNSCLAKVVAARCRQTRMQLSFKD